MKLVIVCAFLLIIPLFHLYAQSSSVDSVRETVKNIQLNGFARAGFYSWVDKTDNKPYISSAYSDLGIKIESPFSNNFNAFADLRFRYGSEFLKQVSSFDFRESYIDLSFKKWDISAGQQILKWGRCDFTNPVNKFSPRNMLSRSPDRGDMDMGSLLSTFNFFPSPNVRLEAVLSPFYRPSKLIIDPVPLPANVTLNKLAPLLTGKNMFSYGLKADFYLKKTDMSVSWFDGFDPMPGIALKEFIADLTQTLPVTHTALEEKPYRIKVLGFDFETTAGAFGIRGEAAYSDPLLSYKTNEYVPLPELNWVAGLDWSSDSWRLIGEYGGKLVTNFTKQEINPLIGSNPDYMKLAELLAMPGFDLEDFVREQIASFNRLYNYQVKRTYHSAGLRIESDLAYGKVQPSVFTMYNFVSRDLMVNPEIKIKPLDGLALTAGAEIYTGRNGSLYDLIDDFMNSFYVSLRVDF